jgi:toxin ParE1/3/4
MKSPKPLSKTLSPDANQERTKLRLSRSAEADFDAIDTHSCEQFGEEVADIYMNGFGEMFEMLRRYPKAGQSERGLGKGIRKLTYRQHRIFYLVDDDLVLIVRIVHHAMDAKRALKGAAA